jgi:hypothetical protein
MGWWVGRGLARRVSVGCITSGLIILKQCAYLAIVSEYEKNPCAAGWFTNLVTLCKQTIDVEVIFYKQLEMDYNP